MSDERVPARKRSGTYLFVRPKAARRPRTSALEAGQTPAPLPPAATPAPDVSSTGATPRGPRLRYRRPRLEPQGIDARLVFFLAPDAPVAEHYRQIAAALTRDRQPARRLWIVGAAQRVGASLTCANLGAALSELGRVTLMDAGAPGSGLAALFGLPGPERRPESVHLDLWLVAERLSLQTEASLLPLTPERTLAFQAVASAADYVLIDGPALDDPSAVEAVRSVADAAVLVVRPADLGTGLYERALDRLQGLRLAGVVVNGAADELLPVAP